MFSRPPGAGARQAGSRAAFYHRSTQAGKHYRQCQAFIYHRYFFFLNLKLSTLYIAALASGSNGNCYYVGNGTDAVLIDAGLGYRALMQRFSQCGLKPGLVRAIFISHEHTDHISGLQPLVTRHHLPVYATPGTWGSGRLRSLAATKFPLFHHQPVQVGSLSILPFLKHHDAAEPCSFVVQQGSCTVGIFTDIGRACPSFIHHFSQCQAAFLESNYCPDMLRQGRYPYFLKQRISGGRGHLSNHDALQLFQHHRHQHLSHLLLSHLSGQNNCPDLVASTFAPHSSGCQVVVCSRQQATGAFSISAARPGGTAAATPPSFYQAQLF